jgi:hypothetical protein
MSPRKEMSNITYKRGDIITHPMAGKAWLHIADVKFSGHRGYVYECINQITGKKVTLLADSNDGIKLISETRKR